MFDIFYYMFVYTLTNILVYITDNWYLREINCMERIQRPETWFVYIRYTYSWLLNR